MNVRALFVPIAISCALAFVGGRAEAGLPGGATYHGEVAYGYGYASWGPFGSYDYDGYGCGCGGYGCGGYGYGACGAGGCGKIRGGFIHGPTAGGGACSSGCSNGKGGRFRKGKACNGGCDFESDYGTPVYGMPDAPAPAPMKPTPALPEAGETASGPLLFRPISHEQVDGATFAQGWHAYRNGNYEAAHEALSDVVSREPSNTAAHYALALTQRELGNVAAADALLAEAVAREAEYPVAGWGKLMERVQGPRRVWLEAARSAAAR
jgi:hypothetical protein